jgi:secreted trypsin-like serine protease
VALSLALVAESTPAHASLGGRAVAAPAVVDPKAPPAAGVTPVTDATVTPKVVGGTPAQAVSYVGDMQLLYQGDPNFHWCGLSLISPSWVETNAHCVTNEPTSAAQKAAASTRFASWMAAHPAAAVSGIDFNDPATWHLRIGSADRTTGGVVRHVTKIVVHPGWAWGVPDAQGRIDDIALMKLDQPIFTLRPATIRQATSHTSVRVLGWGMTTQPTDPARSAPVGLQQIDVPLVDNSYCGGDDFIGAAGEICLGIPAGGGGPCYGDSGTGALQRAGHTWVLVGSASRVPGLSCGKPGQDYAVYTDVHYYLGWMIRVVLGLPEGASVAGRHLPTTAEVAKATRR